MLVSLGDSDVDLIEHFAQTVAKLPVWIIALKFADIADPPDVISDSVRFFVLPTQFFAADLLAKFDCFQHGTVGVPASADVVNLASPRCANELRERLDEIITMNVVAHLFPFVSEHAIGTIVHGADHQIGEKSVQFSAGMGWPGKAAAAQRNGRHSEIASVFLNQNVGSRL